MRTLDVFFLAVVGCYSFRSAVEIICEATTAGAHRFHDTYLAPLSFSQKA